ncbi:protein-glutamate O-methyltransferase CheR [Desulfovibrio mangrovi]|nr:protein-glutamate O-methyltransferase CheR [Desulfovibrio mangrovi]UZP69130.1 protein-glutamate O-methyltransferase CheR [Desulfovibrio mangrovi]
MSDKVFQRLSSFIHERVGIKLPPSKRTMLEARLQKRLRLLNHPSYESYVDYVFSDVGMEKELRNLIDVVTTNTTEFFREPKHFDYLVNGVLPDWIRRHGTRRLKLWSAGCSIGMEPYTLAMVLSNFAEQFGGFSFHILATDISSRALQTAVKAVYDEDRISCIPDVLCKKYLLRSKDRSKKLIRIAPEIRSLVEFQRLNFMEQFSFSNPLDIIFCRNVIIYFDKPTQERLFKQFCECLRPGGFLFIGHSESLAGMNLPLVQAAPTVYRRV